MSACERTAPEPVVIEPAEPPAALMRINAPPIVVNMARSADWDVAQPPITPQIDIALEIPAPVLEPIPITEPIPELEADVADDAALTLAAGDLEQAEAITVAAVVEEEAPTKVLSDRPDYDILGVQVQAGYLKKTTWSAGEALHGASIPTPVLVAHGVKPGPTLCVTAAVHGDELNGIESVRQLMYTIKPEKLSGTVIGVPIVNLQGFQRHSRYLADRRDLNRFFPGNPRGSSAARMAYSFFHEVIRRCDGLVDLHTGSFHRTNLPQLRADLNNADVLALTKGFGATVILHSDGGEGTLRRSAVDAGIPAVTLEAGEPLRLQKEAVDHTVKAVFTLLDTMHMYNKRSLWGNPEPTYYSSAWVRADQGGILLSKVKLGRRIKSGDVLGTVTDPITNEEASIQAPYAGRVIGMALNQFVMPGFATFHIATEAAIDDMPESETAHAEGLDVAVTESLGGEESE